MLRNIPRSESIDGLKDVIKNQLKDEVCSNFDVGCMQGSSPVCLRTKKDLSEIWRTILKGNNMILWCDAWFEKSIGNKKRAVDFVSSDDESELEVTKLRKEERLYNVEKTIRELKTKHRDNFTPMQYRVWAEMHVGGVHNSTDNPPNTTMFSCSSWWYHAISQKDNYWTSCITTVIYELYS